MERKTYIIQKSDVGKGAMAKVVSTPCKCCGHVTTSYPFEPLGRVMEADVGRMLVQNSKTGLWYVESIKQWDERKAKEQHGNSKI